jgi:hypothetical protein
MKEAPISLMEEQRLRALRQYGIMDTAPEKEYDEITRLASEICEVPVSLISLIDDKKQWFKSRIGLDINETPIEHRFLIYMIQWLLKTFASMNSS